MKVTQEVDRVPGKAVLVVTAGVVLATIIGVLAAYFITARRGAELARVHSPPLYDRPLPQVAPSAVPGRMPEEVNQIELVLFRDRAPGLEERARDQAQLRGYGWVDRSAGLVRIPIDRAMQLYVQRHPEERP